MKIKISFFLIALFSFYSCSKKADPLINSLGIIEGQTFLTFNDAEKTRLLNSEGIQFVVTSDNSKIYTMQSNKIGIYSGTQNNTFFQLFNGFSLTKEILKEGLNTIDIVYSNGKIDKISIDISFTTIVKYNSVIFNGKEIIFKKSDTPASNSFVFVLD